MGVCSRAAGLLSKCLSMGGGGGTPCITPHSHNRAVQGVSLAAGGASRGHPRLPLSAKAGGGSRQAHVAL